MEAGRRIADLARDLGVPRVAAAVNKVRTQEDREVVEGFCERHDIPVAAWLPFDDTLLEAERAGRAPLDYAEGSPAVTEIRELAEALLGENGAGHGA